MKCHRFKKKINKKSFKAYKTILQPKNIYGFPLTCQSNSRLNFFFLPLSIPPLPNLNLSTVSVRAIKSYLKMLTKLLVAQSYLMLPISRGKSRHQDECVPLKISRVFAEIVLILEQRISRKKNFVFPIASYCKLGGRGVKFLLKH